MESIGLVEVAAVLGAAYIISEYYIGPNAAQNREVLASSMESVADELVNGINALFARGEYVPPGLTQDERNAYREAVHRYKRGYNIPADVDVPREILDQIAEAIKDGLSSREAADQADPPPEPDLDELDE